MPTTTVPPPGDIEYPESDGEPMSDNTKQFRWITVLAGNLAALYRDRADVFVSGNQNWYPVEGHPEIVKAPDAYVVFGRPKDDRGSYKQWEENNVPMTVVFEVMSPKNTYEEMDEKLTFYEDYGAEEYYVYNPETNRLAAYLRQGDVFRKVRPVNGFVSPRLGIRFDLSGPELIVYGPDGKPFLTFEELVEARMKEAREAEHLSRRWKRIASLSRKARRGQATPEELTELERLEDEAGA